MWVNDKFSIRQVCFESLNFKKLLLSMQDKSMDSQQQLIEETYESWRGEYEQIDDVSVIGVRI